MAKKSSSAPGVGQATAATDVANAGSATDAGTAAPKAEAPGQNGAPEPVSQQTANSSGDQSQGDASGLGQTPELGKSEEGAVSAGLNDERPSGADPAPDPIAKAFELLGDIAPAEGVSFNTGQRPDFEAGKVLLAAEPVVKAILDAADLSAGDLLAAFVSPHRVTLVTRDGHKHTVQRP